MHATQSKTHEASTATKAVETESKAALKAADATRLPAWTEVWENRPPIGLFAPPDGAPVLQAKLEVSQPGDPYEQEADRIAERVMRLQDSQAATLQRQCA